MSEVIVALATALGRSGIGVIRLSGKGSLQLAQKLFRDSGESLEPRRVTLRGLYDPHCSEVIDTALVTYFKSPNSFTGEDVVEFSCHGAPVALRRVIDACLSIGARLAEPGEFSLRALANGRMSLAEAEAIRDLIDAQTAAAARLAIRQMGGAMSRELQPIKDDLLDTIVILESALEFVEDDLPDVQNENLKSRLQAVKSAVAKIADSYRAGHLIRDGLRVAIVGRPNVGKSSLFNALLGTDRAIVTGIAGTTRDQIQERFVVNDIPISLIDTAGLRETSDFVEKIGVERARASIADADLVIVVIDASEDLTNEDEQIIESVRDLNHLVIANKIDKLTDGDLSPALLRISATTGQGLDELRNSIVEPFSRDAPEVSGFLVTDARHYDLLVRARAEIDHSITCLEDRLSEEIVLVGLHNAMQYLGEITGETSTEEMLTRIFSTFCIGK